MSDSLLSVRPAFGSWNRGPLHIEYGLGVLEEIRRTVQEGFHKIPHGGVETGGLLYGKWDGSVLTISAWRPMQCEHPLGPRFQLSGTDELALAAQLAAGVPELEDCQAVGWFASHSRGALLLRGPDVDLHAKFFPEPWQPILLLCASRNQPMQAAFYSRAEGTLSVGAEVSGFEVIPNPNAVPRRARRAPGAERSAERSIAQPTARAEVSDTMRILASQVGSEPVQTVGPELATEYGTSNWAPLAPIVNSPWASRGYERVEEPASEPIVGEVPAQRPADTPAEPTVVAGRLLEPLTLDAAARAAAAPPAYASPAVETPGLEGEAAPKFTVLTETGRSIPWKRLSWAALWLAVAGGGVYAIQRFAVPAPELAVDLKVAEVTGATPGQLAIGWNVKGSSGEVLRSGEVEVADGGETRTFTLSSNELRSGTLTYWRRTGHVAVNLAIRSAEGQPVSGTASFEETPAGAAAAAASDDPALKTLRDQLMEERRRGRQLERQLAQRSGNRR